MLRKIFIAALMIIAMPVYAGKIEFNWGYYNLDTENALGVKGSISSFGSFRFGYRHPFWKKFEFTAGYSFIFSDTFSGDLSYGVDAGVDYFILTRSAKVKASSDSVYLSLEDGWRPYVGLTFVQRQYQALSSQLAGFGVRIGSEFAFKKNWSFKGEGRYSALDGSKGVSATEMVLGLGILYEF